MRTPRILLVWLAVGVAPACPVGAQLTVTGQLQLTGTVEAVAAGRLTVRDENGGRLEVRVQRKDEQGVPLADGRLLAFPAEIEITGGFDIAKLKAGQMVRFRARLNRAGKAGGDIDEIMLVDDGEAPAGVTMEADPQQPADFTEIGRAHV